MESGPDSAMYLDYLEESRSIDDVDRIIRSGCYSIGSDNEGYPAIIFLPELGLPKAFLAGETEASIMKNLFLYFIRVRSDI